MVQSFVRAKGEPLARSFYERFLERDAEVRALFDRTDLDRQRELFVHGIYSLIDYARGGGTGRMGIRRLARIHGENGMGITRRMYALWVTCLLEALQQHDPQWTPALRSAWERVLWVGIEGMMSEDGEESSSRSVRTPRPSEKPGREAPAEPGHGVGEKRNG